MGFEREMPGLEKFDSCLRQVFPKGFRSRRNKERIILAPDRQQRRPRFTEVFLKLRVELHIRRIVEEEIQLSVFVPWSFKERRVQCVRLGGTLSGSLTP